MAYKRYDFSASEKITKEELRSVTLLYENFARLIEASISNTVRTATEVSIDETVQGSFGDYIPAMPTPAFISILSLKPLDGNILMVFSMNLVLFCIDRLLGGTVDSNTADREPTDIEKTVIERIVNKITDCFTETWSHVMPLEPRIVDKETNPQFVRAISFHDHVVMVTLTIKVGTVSGSLQVVMPVVMLKPLISKLNIQGLMLAGQKTKSGTDVRARPMEQNLDAVKIGLSVNLAQLPISLKDLVQLKQGDLVRLRSTVTDSVEVLINKRAKFYARPGLSGRRIAVQLINIKER
jgi:flagellar motor switch protein FliM